MPFTLTLAGKPGTGKTFILQTARLPVLIDSFDPGKTLCLEVAKPDSVFYFETYQDIADCPDLSKFSFFVRRYWKENHHKPTAYALWRERFDQDIETDFLSLFGTYALDSHTNWLSAASNYFIKKMKRKITNKNSPLFGQMLNQLDRSDYPHIYNEVRDLFNLVGSQSCDFIMTAHVEISDITDEDGKATGRKEMNLFTFKGLKTIIPSNVTEFYIAQKTARPKGSEYTLLTENKGYYEAFSHLGASGKLSTEEPQDIKALLRKAGLSADDVDFPANFKKWRQTHAKP